MPLSRSAKLGIAAVVVIAIVLAVFFAMKAKADDAAADTTVAATGSAPQVMADVWYSTVILWRVGNLKYPLGAGFATRDAAQAALDLCTKQFPQHPATPHRTPIE